MAPKELMDRADGEGFAALADQALSEFGQGDVGCLLHGVHEEAGLCFEAPGATVAAAGFCPAASGPEISLHPPYGTGGANAESFGSGGS